MHASDITPEVAARANELYWSSGESVNQIAEKLDLSKGALYGLIEPLQSGLGCPLCGDEVGYPNRTAKEREELNCSTCDWDGSPDETSSYVISADDADEVAERERTPPARFRPSRSDAGSSELSSPERPDVAPPRPFIAPRMSTIATGALVGGALGLVLVLWARRR
jgi:hypothetical protein